MTDKQRFIFLDVDGPLIPESVYELDPYCSMKRSIISTTAVGWINRLCRLTGAKIIMNSSHNSADIGPTNVKQDLVRHGIKEEYFHEDWRTGFPNDTRGVCIENWFTKNGMDPMQHDWVNFDDTVVKTYPRERAILVSYSDGITSKEYYAALKVFGVNDNSLIIL